MGSILAVIMIIIILAAAFLVMDQSTYSDKVDKNNEDKNKEL